MDASQSVSAWYALRVRSGKEKLSARWLGLCGIESDVPMRALRRTSCRGRVHKISVPAMPGYLMMAVPLGAEVLEFIHRAREYDPIRNAVGTPDGRPLRLDGDWQAQLDQASLDPEVPRPIDYEVGNRVKVLSGSLSGLFADVTAISANEVKLLMPWFAGRMQEIRLPLHHVRRAA